MIYKSEFKQDVPDDLKQKHHTTFIKMNESKFVSKVLLLSLIPWVWMCLLSYVFIGYFDKKEEQGKQEYTMDVSLELNSQIDQLAQSGNVHALLFLAEKGSDQQKEMAYSALKSNESIEVRYFDDVVSKRMLDIPSANLDIDQHYVGQIISYAELGYAKAIDDLIELEKKILNLNQVSTQEKAILEKIKEFKEALNNNY